MFATEGGYIQFKQHRTNYNFKIENSFNIVNIAFWLEILKRWASDLEARTTNNNNFKFASHSVLEDPDTVLIIVLNFVYSIADNNCNTHESWVLIIFCLNRAQSSGGNYLTHCQKNYKIIDQVNIKKYQPNNLIQTYQPSDI